MKVWLCCAFFSGVLAVSCDLSIATWNESCVLTTYLSCDCQYFGTLTPEFFAGAPNNVTSISLSGLGSNISSIKNGTFSVFTNLERVQLRSLGISSIDSGVFTGPTLNDVPLEDNALTSLDFTMFQNPMVNVYVDQNKFIFLDLSNFIGESVSASRNSITSLRVVNSSIKELTLNYNPLQQILVKNFSNLPNLKELSCDYCEKLTYLEPGVFSGMSQLQAVIAMYAGLKWIEPGVFVDLPNLLGLSFSSLLGLGQFVSTPKLSGLNIGLRFVSSNLLALCNCSLNPVNVEGISYVCPPGSKRDNTLGGCACDRDFICLYTGPKACGPGTFSLPGVYVDSADAKCPSCPVGTHLTELGCVFCPAGYLATSTNCTACSNPSACPPGSPRALSDVQVEELKNPFKIQKPPFDVAATPIVTDNSLGVLITFTLLALLGFWLIPWLARKWNLSHKTASYVDLMSLAHRVVLGKSLIREATWLGVAMSCAVVCGSVIMAVFLVESNAPINEYYLKFWEDVVNPENSMLFELTPWLNDPSCQYGSSFNLNTSLLASYERVQCTENIRWRMARDTQLSFDVPIIAQLVKWQVTSTDLYGKQNIQSGFVSPSPDHVFASSPVTLAFTVRDASFNNLGIETQGLQVVYTQVDYIPTYIHTPMESLSHWHLDVTLDMLDTTLYGRMYRPQSNAQVFAAIFSIIMSLVAAARSLFAYGIEPMAQTCCKDKTISKIPDVDISKNVDYAAELSEHKKLIQQLSEAQTRYPAELSELRNQFHQLAEELKRTHA